MTANLLAEYSARPGKARRALTEPMVTITGSRPSASRGSDCAADLGHGEDVDLEDLAEHRRVVRLELAGRTHAGVVDHQVERTEAFAGQRRRAVRDRHRRQVGRDGDHPRRIGPFTLEASRQRAARRSADRPVRMTVAPARTRCSARA